MHGHLSTLTLKFLFLKKLTKNLSGRIHMRNTDPDPVLKVKLQARFNIFKKTSGMFIPDSRSEFLSSRIRIFSIPDPHQRVLTQ
jgi:hypothetical protein